MSYTVDEKYNYNLAQNTDFSKGYCLAVRLYRNPNKGLLADRKKRNAFIDDMSQGAKKHRYCKGFMCGIRDCANERKAKYNK